LVDLREVTRYGSKDSGFRRRETGILGHHWSPIHDGRQRGRAEVLTGRAHDVAARIGGTAALHTREDEYSYILRGRFGALLGDEVVFANPGDLVFKPRHQWHTFWNAGDEPSSFLEMISPGGFEHFFHELSDLGGIVGMQPRSLDDLCRRYGLEMAPESVPDLVRALQPRLSR